MVTISPIIKVITDLYKLAYPGFNIWSAHGTSLPGDFPAIFEYHQGWDTTNIKLRPDRLLILGI